MKRPVFLLLASLAVHAQTAPAQDAAFDKLAAQAEEARTNHRPEAPELFANALRLRPAWKDGWWALGSLDYQKDDYQGCVSAFQRLTLLDAKSGAAFSMLGLCEFSIKQYDAALEHLRRGQDAGVGIPGVDEVAKYHLAQVYTRAGNFESALGILVSFAQMGKENPPLITLAGIAALWKPILPENLSPDDRELVFLAGRAFWAAGARNATGAQQLLESLKAKYPKTPGVFYLSGSIELQDEPDKALADFQEELQISPKHVGALSAIAAEYLRRGEPKPGLPYARKCVEILPDSVASHAILGRLLTEDGDFQGGLRELETAKRLGPENPQIRIALASVYAKLGRTEDAARERREFIRLNAPKKNE